MTPFPAFHALKCLAVIVAHSLVFGPTAICSAGDVLWDNGNRDMRSGWLSQRGGIRPTALSVDDFDVATAACWRITGIQWDCFRDDANFVWAGSYDILVFPNLAPHGRRPAETPLLELRDVLPRRAPKWTGKGFVGYQIYENQVDGLQIRLRPGIYWLGLRLVSDFNTGYSGWLTSHTLPEQPLRGSQLYYREPGQGEPKFVPGYLVSRFYQDLNFKLYGQSYLFGDLNCDAAVNFADINPFVLALSDPDEYARQYPDCDALNGDVNFDGRLDFANMNPFVELLAGG